MSTSGLLQGFYQLFGASAGNVYNDSSVKIPPAELRRAQTMIRHAEQAQSVSFKYASAVTSELGLRTDAIQMGKIKELQRIWDKANERYGGDISRVGDISRERLLVDNPGDVIKVRNLFVAGKAGRFHEDWLAKGVEVTEFTDYFAKPTSTGFLGINIKLMIDLGKGRKAPNELQIVHREMLRTLDNTHAYYEAKRKLVELAATQGRKPSKAEQELIDGIEDMTREMHERDGERLGLVSLRTHKGPLRVGENGPISSTLRTPPPKPTLAHG